MKEIAVSVEDSIRMNVCAMAVTAVGKDMVRDAKYFRLATRICAEPNPALFPL